MTRTEVIQKIIDKKQAQNYLEIGVDFGDNFFPIRAKRKTAVDPTFKFSGSTRWKWTWRNPCNLFARFHEVTSDAFFRDAPPPRPIEVAFIDGLHTYEQSLQDVLNTLEVLAEDGVIVMHDCHPPNAAAAHPAKSLEDASAMNLPGWTHEWCGDVWKTVCRLRLERDDLSIFVLDCDYGLGVVTRGAPERPMAARVADVSALTYDDLAADREGLINLKAPFYLETFLKTL